MNMSFGSPLFTCAICGQENLNADNMNTHMLAMHAHTQCPMCNLAGVSADELEYHVNTAHANILSPTSSGHSSIINGHIATNKWNSPATQNRSVHISGELNSQKNGDGDQAKCKTLLALSKEHARKTGAVCDDVRTKDATGRKVKNSRKKAKESTQESQIEKVPASMHVQYPIPKQQSSSLDRFPEDEVASSSSSSSFSIISAMEIQHEDDLAGHAIGDDRSSTSSVQSPLKKRVKTSLDTSSDNSIFSAIKNILRSPFKGENTGSVEFSGILMENLSKSPRNACVPSADKSTNELKYLPLEDGSEASVCKSAHEFKHCPLCEYSSTDVTSLAYHVDEHFSVDTNDDEELARKMSQVHEAMKTDEMVARQIEKDERMRVEKEEATQFQELQKKYGMNDSGSYKKQAQKVFDRALAKGEITVSDYYNQMQSVNLSLNCGIDDGRSRTRGLVTKLYEYYGKGVAGVPVVRLCVDTSHYCSAPGDKGWGCGYKNIQMLMAAMCNDPRFKKSVFNGSTNMPSISKIQQLIEKAWDEGYDQQGRDQLGGRIYNTRKWIGATEVVALFTSLKVRCNLIDFHHPTGPNKTHTLLFDWVQKYFGSTPALGSLFNKKAICSNKLPLYLQHEGHSRTIIGYEQLKDKSIRLLLFDPSLSQKQLSLLKAPELTGYVLKPLRQTLTNLKSKQYQIVYIQGNLTDQESKSMKILTSHRIP